jgi:inositol transport system substrate-binding protein
MKKNIALRAIFLAILAIGVLPSLRSESAKALAAEKKFVLGFEVGNEIYPFHVRLRASVLEHGRKAGMEVLIADSKSDVATEVTNIENFITQGANVIATCPIDPEGTVVGSDQCWKAGVPYIAACGIVNGKHIYVGSNDEEAGLMQAEWLAKELPRDAKFLYLSMNPVENSTILRRKGLQKLFELRPDVKMLSEQNARGRADEGLRVTETWLQSFSDFDAIVGQNDDMVLGAIEALKAANLNRKIITLGVDGGFEAIDSVLRGEMTATAYQDAYAIGATIVEVAARVRNGEDPDKIGNQIVHFKMVTKDNAGEYIDLVKVR